MKTIMQVLYHHLHHQSHLYHITSKHLVLGDLGVQNGSKMRKRRKTLTKIYHQGVQ
jgi:hypothetical protein